LQEDDEIVTLQVGKTVWDQAPRQMRVELWMSSLQRRGVGVAAAAKYEDMLLTVRVLHVARACAFLQSGCGGGGGGGVPADARGLAAVTSEQLRHAVCVCMPCGQRQGSV
jgi:hypothetical protein